jgi:hypothetical protein
MVQQKKTKKNRFFFFPFSSNSEKNREKKKQISRTRAESQQIVIRDHSTAYNTRFQLGRLRRILPKQYFELRLTMDTTALPLRVVSHYGFWDFSLFLHDKYARDTTSRSSMDSDLEAFSHFPTCDSFAALSFQTTALPIARIKCSSRTNLNY